MRLSGRLTSSPACLVVAEEEMSPNLEKLMNQAKGETVPAEAHHGDQSGPRDWLRRCAQRLEQNADDPVLEDFANILYGYALLAEGSEIPRASEIQRGGFESHRKGDLIATNHQKKVVFSATHDVDFQRCRNALYDLNMVSSSRAPASSSTRGSRYA